MKKTTLSTAILLASTFSSINTVADNHNWELTAGLGYRWFDSDRALDNTPTAHIGAGYVLNPRWTLEAMASGFS